MQVVGVVHSLRLRLWDSKSFSEAAKLYDIMLVTYVALLTNVCRFISLCKV